MTPFPNDRDRTTLDSIVFPVLSISQGSLSGSRDADGFTIATKDAVKSGHFKNMWLLDSAGNAFLISGCKIVEQPAIEQPRTAFGRGVRLHEFEVASLPPPNLEEARQKVMSAVKANEDIWSAGGDINVLLENIGAASSFTKLIGLFT